MTASLDNAAPSSPQVVIVTGMSGAGKSTALRALEDSGYETVDNLPLTLLDAVAAAGASDTGAARPMALGIDVRTRNFDAAQLLRTLDDLRLRAALRISVVFLDCDNEALGRRYTETRRPHPLADGLPVAVGIDLERQLLAPLRGQADVLVDTSHLPAHDLKRILQGQFAGSPRPMRVFLMSFGYRHGLPREADLVLDVRFLKNPHYVPELQPLTGLDPAVGAYITRDPALTTFLERARGLLEPLLPLYEREGKSYLTIAIGCTGGKHRSVFVVERLKAWLEERKIDCGVRHRDLTTARESA